MTARICYLELSSVRSCLLQDPLTDHTKHYLAPSYIKTIHEPWSHIPPCKITVWKSHNGAWTCIFNFAPAVPSSQEIQSYFSQPHIYSVVLDHLGTITLEDRYGSHCVHWGTYTLTEINCSL